jgi:tRNA(Ile)-lysidine synthase
LVAVGGISSRLYHVAVHSLTERVLDHIRRQELLRAGQRVGTAVSGGIDSVALLRLLLELRGQLGIVLSVVHFNHKLRGAESEGDQGFVAGIAREHDLEFICDSDDVAGHAAEESVSLETAGRELRYGFFRHLLKGTSGAEAHNQPSSQERRAGSVAPPIGGSLDVILTGHTLDDQAETVLMRLIRGTGPTGLGGIYPRIAVEGDSSEVPGEIVRPLLATRRIELEGYLKDIGQDWREDSTNTDDSFTRNRVRKLVVPLLEKEFNPSIAENLAELAEIARGEEDYWQNEVGGWMGTGVHWSLPEWAQARSDAGLVQIAANFPASAAKDAAEMGHPSPDDLETRINNASWLVMNATVDLLWFLGEPAAVQRRVIKAIGEEAGIPLWFKHVEEILRFAAEHEKSGKEISLPLGWKVERRSEDLLFVTPDLRSAPPIQDYEYELSVPGQVAVAEAGFVIQVQSIPVDEARRYNPDQLLNADSLPRLLRVRNWRAGDRFWPAHTKSPKKIKELLQEQHVEQPRRGLWPVVVGEDGIIWIRGFPTAKKHQFKGHGAAILITERPFVGKF